MTIKARIVTRRWLYGWLMWARAVRMMRTKKHGAGKQPWLYAFRMGAAYRWIVDGQMRNGQPPKFLRRDRD